MSPANKKRSSLASWLIASVLLVAAGFMWLERQLILDSIQYYQYTPSSQVEEITSQLSLTDRSKFLFYASHPAVEDKDSFNKHCERREATSPILGCYGNQRIYVYDIKDERLDGIQEVTAAHELLHAIYERLSDGEKQRINSLLQAAYDSVADDELKKRMEYYSENEPGEHYNELHSIIPTEFKEIGSELDEYYKQYFTDRQAIVELHTKVDSQFTKLSTEADDLVKKINALASRINNDTEAYNSGVANLNSKVVAFNNKNASGGFTTQAEFNAERSVLEAERAQLEVLRGNVKANIDTYKQLKLQYDSISTQIESLNESIDSVLSDEPEI